MFVLSLREGVNKKLTNKQSQNKRRIKVTCNNNHHLKKSNS